MRMRKITSQRGASLVEYAMLVSLLTLMILPATRSMFHGTNRTFCSVIMEKSREQLVADGNYNEETGHCISNDSDSYPGMVHF